MALIVPLALTSWPTNAVRTQAPKPRELVELRTAQSKTFANPDGTRTTTTYLEPVHFRDSSGRMQPISTRLVPHGSESVISERNGFRAAFDRTPGRDFVRLQHAGRHFRLTLEGARPVAGSVSGSRIRYPSVARDTALEYQSLPNGVKETLVLGSREAPASYRFRLTQSSGSQLRPERRADGSWTLRDSRRGGPALVMPPPWAVDANGAITKGSDVELDVVADGNELVLDLSIDRRWLTHERRAFPVMLDPAMTVSVSEYALFDDACGACTGTSYYELKAGTTGTERWRSALRFNLAGVREDATITKAHISIDHSRGCFEAGCASVPHTFNLHQQQYEWTPTSLSSNVRYFYTNVVASDTMPAGAPAGALEFDVSDLAERWHSGAQPNHGVVIKRATEPAHAGGISFLYYQARLSVTYRLDPVDSTMTMNVSDYARFDDACSACTGISYYELQAGTTGTERWRSALRFNLAGVPANATITKAHISIDHSGGCFEAGCASVPHTFNVHQQQYGWSSKSSSSDVRYFYTDVVASDTMPAGAPAGALEFDVSDLAQRWHSGAQPNHGVVIKRATEPAHAGGISFLYNRVQLTLTYRLAPTPCPSSAPKRTVAVSLINIPLFLNRFGDVVPEGRMYVLDENIQKARETFARAADPRDQKDIIEPLVLRANRGDCVEVWFTNRLNEAAPNFNRDDSIFPLPGETLLPAGTVTPNPREFAPAATKPDNDFDPARAPRASMHFTGLTYNVKDSDGTAAGNNPDSTVAPGARRVYRLHADREGEFMFQDGADLSSRHNNVEKAIGSNAFGAFGAIMVEPPDATWVDVNTGAEIKSGTRAIIKHPGRPDFREHVLFMHDEVEAEPGILTRFCIPPRNPALPSGSECINPNAAELAKLRRGTLPALGGGDADALVNGEVPVKLEWFAFNYRSEPGFNREEVDCPPLAAPFRAPGCVGEETSLSSWPFGDPGGGDLVFRNYRGEPMQIRLFHSAETETHTFHWHIHRWPFDPADEGGLDEIVKPTAFTKVTNPLDVQAVSPGAHYSLIPEGGAGSAHHPKPATFGDVIFHCHLYPHFANGMWGLNRVHDVRERGTRTNPDGTRIDNLVPLEDFDHDGQTANGTTPPPEPTTQKAGFPKFVPGVFGRKAPKPPLGVPERQAGGEFPPTEPEKAAAEPDAQKPGAFFIDPCPTGAPLKRFDVAAIQIKAEYNNDLKWNNPHHRMYVLQADKAAILAGTKKPEPFSPLLNIGDCVEYRLTNDLPGNFGGTVFDRAQETNEVSIHQHMVQFDVLSSDGAANGWNYDQGADAAGVLGRPAGQTITFRDYVSSDVRTNSFHDHFFPNVHQDSGLFGGSTIHPRGCTFHDPATGNPVAVGTIVDIRCQQTVDHRGKPTTGEDYRNVSLFVEDHVPMFQPANATDPNDDQFVTPFGVPIFPAKFPSSPDDNGAMGINYRLEPFEARRNSDPANLFSSSVHGDPITPVPRAFAGDDVKFRLFQLSMEESHAMNLHRWPWPFERDEAPGESNIVQAQHVGMLEYFDLHLGKIDLAREDPNPQNLELRDYLYHLGGADDAFLGAWGIFRVAGCNPNDLQIYKNTGLPPLQPLPDNTIAACTPGSKLPVRTAGNVCPTDSSGTITAPIKRFTVVAINKDVVYNNAGEHDPNGVMYVLEADLTAVQNGTKRPEPLVLRVNVGDCVEVTLKNQLDPAKMKPHCFEALEPGQLGFVDPAPDRLTLPGCLDQPPKNEVNVPGFKPFPVSARVSLHPGLVKYHIGSDGARVGYNFDSTVAPGGSIQYRWFAHRQGTAILEDRADMQNHPHHGLYGALVVEPRDSGHRNPRDGTDLRSGEQAVIEDPNGPDFRENIVLMNSDLSLFKTDGFPVADDRDLRPGNGDEANDPEDQGEFSINYRNEPWVHRLARNPAVSNVFSSPIHGDPATPLFNAYEGDPVRFRVAQAEGDPRSTGFALHGHTWQRSPNDPQSQIAALQGQFNPAQVFDININQAGGPANFPGDYLYRSNTLLRHLPGGQWGLFRVHDTPQPNTIPLPDRANP